MGTSQPTSFSLSSKGSKRGIRGTGFLLISHGIASSNRNFHRLFSPDFALSIEAADLTHKD
jgi:hypothetical protein